MRTYISREIIRGEGLQWTLRERMSPSPIPSFLPLKQESYIYYAEYKTNFTNWNCGDCKNILDETLFVSHHLVMCCYKEIDKFGFNRAQSYIWLKLKKKKTLSPSTQKGL